MRSTCTFFLVSILFASISSLSFGQNNPKEYSIINDIIIAGNKVTIENVVLRELLFQKGDTIINNDLDKSLKKTEESLLNTALFNFATINIIPQQENYINIFILLEERWYLWPYPILEHADRNLSNFLHDKDWSRINYGMMLVKNNFRGRNETLSLKLRLGYKEQYQFMYSVPYLFHSKKHALSMEFSYFRQNEIAYNTFSDKLVFYKDNNNYVKQFQNFYLTYTNRIKHFTRHSIKLGYYHTTIQDTINTLNQNYFDFDKTETQYLHIQYIFNHDKRDYHYYPLSGYNIYSELSQIGSGLLKDELKGISSFGILFNNYQKHSTRWFTGYGLRGKISTNIKQPYFLEEGLGYSDYLRGYEYYVIGGQSYFSTKSFVKFAIIPRKVNYIPAVRWSKFNKVHYSVYANAFFETGYVHDINPLPQNILPNTFLMSAGLGIDIAAYYDQVYRFEYSINKKGEHGFFLHVKKAF